MKNLLSAAMILLFFNFFPTLTMKKQKKPKTQEFIIIHFIGPDKDRIFCDSVLGKQVVSYPSHIFGKLAKNNDGTHTGKEVKECLRQKIMAKLHEKGKPTREVHISIRTKYNTSPIYDNDLLSAYLLSEHPVYYTKEYR